MYRLREFSWLTGRGRWMDSGAFVDSTDELPWDNLNDLNTYGVYSGSDCVVEFNGIDGNEVRIKLNDPRTEWIRRGNGTFTWLSGPKVSNEREDCDGDAERCG